MPDKLKEITATVRFAWTDGSLKAVAAAIAIVLSVVVGTVWPGWEKVSQWFALFSVALIVCTLISPTFAGTSRDCVVDCPYGNTREGILP